MIHTKVDGPRRLKVDGPRRLKVDGPKHKSGRSKESKVDGLKGLFVQNSRIAVKGVGDSVELVIQSFNLK